MGKINSIKLLGLLSLITLVISCSSKNENKISDEIINEEINNIVEDQEIEIDDDNNELIVPDKYKYIKKYYTFQENYIKREYNMNNVDFSGSVNNYPIEEMNLYVERNNLTIISLFFNKTDCVNFPVAGLDFDVVMAYLECYVTRGYEPHYLISDDEISCVGTTIGQEGEKTCMSYYSNGYLKRMKGRVIVGENLFANLDITLTNYRK